MTCLAPNRFRTRFLSAVLAITSLTAAGYAQANGPLLRVEVPFAFESNSHYFVAGTYFVRVGMQGLTIEGSGAPMTVYTMRDEDLDAAPKSSLVFRQYGDRYFLSEVRVAGRKVHVRCVPTKAEKQEQIALANQHPAGVAVALLDSPK